MKNRRNCTIAKTADDLGRDRWRVTIPLGQSYCR